MPSHAPRRSFEKKKNMEQTVDKKPPRMNVNVNIPELDMNTFNKHSHMLVSPTSSQAAVTNKSSSGRWNCLCSPTTHAGSFRCRHHRSAGGIGGMHRGRSVGSNLHQLGDKAGAISDSLNAQ